MFSSSTWLLKVSLSHLLPDLPLRDGDPLLGLPLATLLELISGLGFHFAKFSRYFSKQVVGFHLCVGVINLLTLAFLPAETL